MARPIAFQARIERSAASVREDAATTSPLLAQLVQEPNSPYHDGAVLILVDLLKFRGDHEALVERILGWDQHLLGEPK